MKSAGKNKLRVGVIGVGSLGSQHARIYANMTGVDLVGVCDTKETKAARVGRKLKVRPYFNHRKLLPEIQAASIAVPTDEHYTVARDCLR